MTVYVGSHWTTFFATTASAAATLAGLVIVAISVNVKPILDRLHLPGRAAATIATLILVLVTDTAGMLPGQALRSFGWETLGLGLLAWPLQVWAAKLSRTAEREYSRPTHESVIVILTGHVQVIPFIIGGIELIVGHSGGLYWIGGGTMAVFLFSTLNMWVLLIEILR